MRLRDPKTGKFLRVIKSRGRVISHIYDCPGCVIEEDDDDELPEWLAPVIGIVAILATLGGFTFIVLHL